MDENIEYFFSRWGSPIDRQYVPATSIEKYRGKLPDRLLAYWGAYGWAGYGDGLFWTVNPDEFEPALEAWIGETEWMERDAWHVIARSAFGDLFFCGERTGPAIRIAAPRALLMVRPVLDDKPYTKEGLDLSLRSFFSSKKPNSPIDFNGVNGPLFKAARQKLGQLTSRQMYGFVPALALGGPATLEHLQVVDAVEHLVLLAQLQPLRTISSETIGQYT